MGMAGGAVVMAAVAAKVARGRDKRLIEFSFQASATVKGGASMQARRDECTHDPGGQRDRGQDTNGQRGRGGPRQYAGHQKDKGQQSEQHRCAPAGANRHG
jgi:hypothetical protein